MFRTARLASTSCLLAILFTPADNRASAQEPFVLSTHQLGKWVEQIPVPNSHLQEAVLARLSVASEEIRPFSGESIVGLGITGRVQFTNDHGLVRVVLVDDQANEYLAYETYPLIAPGTSFQIRDACRETCLLPPIVPTMLKLELIEASLDIQTIVTNQVAAISRNRTETAPQTIRQMQDVKAAQETEIIDLLNRQIKAKGLKWIAGETAISRLSYAEKKKTLPCIENHPDTLPNFQGAEYYKGGIFDVIKADATSSGPQESSALIESFDWRSRHGANRPGSPYYDGDENGSGWMTSVKTQLCGDCWAHSALGAIEGLANLYFNHHVDLNLSEQALVSCGGAGSCAGGNTGLALSYVQRAGVVDEECFPESGFDQNCSDCCPSPHERIFIAGFDYIFPSMGEDYIKRRLIGSGPLPFGISSWWHAMVLVGYTTEPGTGDTVWIVKNSWGPDWGEHGFGYVKVNLSDIYLTYNLYTPVVSQLTSYSFVCRDADGDKYFNWGISRDGALACPNASSVEDCDDSDSTVQLMTDDGGCIGVYQPDTTAPSITATVTPSAVWPPNGHSVPIIVSGTITDTESGVDAATARYEVTDEYGRVQVNGPVALDSNGGYTISVWLESAREGRDREGRRYDVTVMALDMAKNNGSLSNVVLVPHDVRRSGSLSDQSDILHVTDK